jgi:hypothetical protein
MSSKETVRRFVKRVLPKPARELYRRLATGYSCDDFPGMISIEERQFYSRCSKEKKGDLGSIVDLGCWMGATTAALANGLTSNGAGLPPTEVIHAYDQFLWQPWMDYVKDQTFGVYESGESFLPEARRRVAGYGKLIQMHAADLTRFEWAGGPIKILLVDAMKSSELAKAITMNFFPSLLTGALLIHQDYKHYFTPWIHVLQYRLKDYCAFIHSVPHSGTVCFRILSPIPLETIHEAADLTSVEDKEVEAAIGYSLSLVGTEGAENIGAAHVMHYLHNNNHIKAREIHRQYAARGMADRGDMQVVEDRLRGLG